MTAYIASSEFAKQCMLVSLNIKQYAAKKEDKKVSRKVAADHAADTDSGAYMKNLVPKEHLEPITKAVSALRTFHYENTLPWLDEGVRILASQNYTEYRAQFDTLLDTYDVAVRDFVNAWPDIVDSARKTRGALFNEADYPEDIKSKFGVKLDFRPLPDTADFRVNISDNERELLRRAIDADQQAAQQAAMGDLYKRLAGGVKAMAVKLRDYKRETAEGKASGVFRDSLVENLRDLVALVPRLNFTQDAELESIRLCVERELCGEDAATLRENDSVRMTVAESAEAIAARLGEFVK